MVIIYMRISQSISLLIIFILAIAINADNTYNDASTLGAVADPPPFELMDLTALLNSLNITYEQLAQNLSTLSSPTSSSSPITTSKNDAGSSNPISSTQSQSQTPPPAVSPTQITPSTGSKTATSSTGGSTSSDSGASQKADPAKTTTTMSSSAKTANSLQSNSNNIQTPQNPTPPVTPTPKTTQTQAQTNSKPSTKPPSTSSSVTSNPPSTSTSAPTTPTPTPSPTSTPTPTPSTTQTNSKSTTNLQSSASNTKTLQSSAATSTTVTPTTSSSSSSYNNAPPTFGPGPNDKSLPPVIDISKLVVDTSLVSAIPATPPTPTSNTNSQQQNQATPKPTTPSSSQSTSSQPVNSQPTPKPSNSQTQTGQPSNVQNTPQPKPAEVKPVTSQKPATTQYTAPVSQNNPNNVYLPPVVSSQGTKSDTVPPKKPATPVYPPSDNDSPLIKPQSQSSSPLAYQCWVGSKDALYTITPSYKAFSKYFIITGKDQYLPNIQSYLIGNYGNYLQGSTIIAGFRLYNTYGDNSLDYQILYSTNYGTFTSILTYWPDTANIQLKSLSILNFYIMEIDYSNCQQQDPTQQNCNICNEGYRNYFGRCQPYDSSCLNYITDECGKCGNGKRLSSGICQ